MRALLLGAAVVGALGLGLSAAPANAGVNIDIHLGSHPAPPVYGPQPAQRIWVDPVYRTTYDQVWSEPVYQTVSERIWVEPVYQTINDSVWVPDRYEDRQIVQYEQGQRIVRTEHVLVEPAHMALVPRQIVAQEGHYEEVTHQQLISGGWQSVQRQELVTPGHWEYVAVRVPPAVVVAPDRFPRRDVRIPPVHRVDIDIHAHDRHHR
jgi:hypothetical protein